MTKVSMNLVKELRERTHAPMTDCKKALEATDGNVEDAVDFLRKQGLALMVKRGERDASEGLVGAYAEGSAGVLVVLGSETDFVARNEVFQGFVEKVTMAAFQNKCEDVAALEAVVIDGKTVKDMLAELVSSIRENIVLKAVRYFAVSSGSVVAYVHDKASQYAGKIGVLAAVNAEKGDSSDLREFAKKIAMHIAASNPLFAFKEDVDSASLERERVLAEEKAKESGKPDNIVEKMVEGRMRVYYETVVLALQPFLFENSQNVMTAVQDFGKTSGDNLSLAGFVCLKVKG